MVSVSQTLVTHSVEQVCPEETLCLVPFRYLKYTLDQHVENDYTIIYFHYGLSSQNKPSLGWLQNAYKEFDRKCVQSTLGDTGVGCTQGLNGGRVVGYAVGRDRCRGLILVMERVHLGEGYRISTLLACCRRQTCIIQLGGGGIWVKGGDLCLFFF